MLEVVVCYFFYAVISFFNNKYNYGTGLSDVKQYWKNKELKKEF